MLRKEICFNKDFFIYVSRGRSNKKHYLFKKFYLYQFWQIKQADWLTGQIGGWSLSLEVKEIW